MMLIPKDYLDSKYYAEISKYLKFSQLSFLLVAEAINNPETTRITRGAILNLDDYVRRTYGDKITSYRKNTAKEGAKKLKEAGILKEYHIEVNHLVCTFEDEFYKNILKENLMEMRFLESSDEKAVRWM